MYVAIRKAADRAGAMVKRSRDRLVTARTTKPLVPVMDDTADEAAEVPEDQFV
jgi:hypothetical protein